MGKVNTVLQALDTIYMVTVYIKVWITNVFQDVFGNL